MTRDYIGDIEVQANRRRAVRPEDQKALDAYWKVEDRRNRAIERGRVRREKKKNPSTGDQLNAAAGLATGHVTAENVKTVAQVAANKSKLRVKIIAMCMVPILAVTFIFIANAQPMPDIVNLTGAMCHTYSTDTWTLTLERKKRMQELVVKANEYDNRDNKAPAYIGALKTYKGLSKDRFAVSKGYAEDYVDINNTILAYAEEHCPITVDGVQFNGLWVLTYITSESGHTANDPTKTLIQVLPTKHMGNVNTTLVGDALANYTIVDYFKLPEMYNSGFKPWGTIWWRQDNYKGTIVRTQQGPFTMQAGTNTEKHLAGRPSEWDHIVAYGEKEIQDMVDACGNDGLWEEMKAWCWGGTESGRNDVSSVGDRFCMEDALTDIALGCQENIDNFTKWYKKNNYTFENDYERIMWLRMMHWFPYFYDPAAGWSEETEKSTVAFIKALNTGDTHNLFVEGVANALDKWDDKGINGDDKAYDSCNAYMNRIDHAFIANVYESAIKRAPEFYDGFKEEYIKYGVYSGDGQFYKTDGKTKTGFMQTAYEFTYYKFNYMMYEALYNEGSGMSDTSES